MPNFKAKKTNNTTAEIEIFDVIGPDWAGLVSAKMVSRELKKLKQVQQINVSVNSPGGSVWEGLTIYNLLKDHQAHVHLKVYGIAASAASLIAMAGDEIEIAENSQMMIHNPWTMAMGESDDLRNAADVLDKIKEQGAQIYADRSGIDVNEILSMMEAETWLTGKEAVEKGLATKLGKNKAANAMMMVSSRFDFKNVPSCIRVIDDEQMQIEESKQESQENVVPEWKFKIEQERRELAEIA